MGATEQQLQYLRQLVDGANRIAVLTGAGMSTESGIPDFRSANGLWSKDMSLAEAISIDYFRRDPAGFWRVFRDIFRIKLVGGYQPNAGHRYLAALEADGKEVTILTQNIDGLHGRAGNRRVLELHGTLLTASCPDCRAPHGLDYVQQHELPLCRRCGAALKPDVVLYGEAVPLIDVAFQAALNADLLLVMGSSLEVSPVNLIPVEAAQAGIPCALINYTPTRFDALFDLCVQGGIGETCGRLSAAS
ncbi:NAD-dependent protein deacylase [Chromobacterium phragmitis]|uniref:NAD-dependent protein deacetylase n=1 Tax=Chromobacterium phragmitis TaxID=2202141 RepID=A0A344UIV3_9NEIS|nr:NAD-dependent protein deacylase [Chromobacterium phragmitis]AXE29808.1 NAD-dependent protein deacylase [Chromobacterium phragmitis]AXE35201.1 NAD-dependent protein deacylase [Chromobacterium phragmitis]